MHNDITYLIVYALVEKNTQRPPIGADIISMARIDLGRKVGECAGLARQDLAWNYVGSHILAPSQRWFEKRNRERARARGHTKSVK